MNSIAFIILILLFSETKAQNLTHSCKDIDILLSEVWRMGDSKRLWPEKDEALQEFCMNSLSKNEVIIEFFDEQFPDNSHIQILSRLTSIERSRLLISYCKSKAQRAIAIKLMIAMNKVVKQMEKIRTETLKKLIEFSSADSTATLKDLHELLDKYEVTTYKCIKDPNLQKILRNLMDQERRLTSYYLDNFKKIRLQSPENNPCPEDWEPKSLHFAEAVALNRILYNL